MFRVALAQMRVDGGRREDNLRRTVARIRARAWGDPRRMAPVKLEVIQYGDVTRVAFIQKASSRRIAIA